MPTCIYFAKGECKRGDNCRYKHEKPLSTEAGPSAAPCVEPEDESKDVCGICFDQPEEFGLLVGCDHIFCLECVRYLSHANSLPKGMAKVLQQNR